MCESESRNYEIESTEISNSLKEFASIVHDIKRENEEVGSIVIEYEGANGKKTVTGIRLYKIVAEHDEARPDYELLSVSLSEELSLRLQNSSLRVLEAYYGNWYDEDGACGTIDFTEPDNLELRHGWYYISQDWEDYDISISKEIKEVKHSEVKMASIQNSISSMKTLFDQGNNDKTNVSI